MRKIVRENPNLVLIIVGHTFYQGTDISLVVVDQESK